MKKYCYPLDNPLFLDVELTICALRYPLQLILPYLQLDIKYFDLGLEYRDAVRSPSMSSLSHADDVAYDIPICVPTHSP